MDNVGHGNSALEPDMRKSLLAAPLLAACLSLDASADTDLALENLMLMSMEEYLSLKIRIASNTDQTLYQSPSVVSVITAEDIKATGATSLSDILQSVPGVHVRANLFAFRPRVTFRGAAGTHTLLMVNGEPLSDLVWNTGIFWKGLSIHMIDRIEIIRGPGSAMFGSDASAGVINIITKATGMIERSEAGIRAGSFDSQTGWMNYSGNWHGFDIGLSAELSRTNGHRPHIHRDGQTGQDTATGSNVSFAPGRARYGWSGEDAHFSIARGGWHLLIDHAGMRDVEIGLTGAAVLDPRTRGQASRQDVALFYNDENFRPELAIKAELRLHHQDFSSGEGFFERPPGYQCTPPTVPTQAGNCGGIAAGTYDDGLINRMRSSERGYRLEASGLYRGLKNHAISLGIGYGEKDLYSVEHAVNYGRDANGNLIPTNANLADLADSAYAFAPEKIRRVGYLYLQDIWSFAPDWELTAGARYDDYSDFGDTFNPRLALVWQTTERLTSKLMHGRAFRAPSYLELYSPTAANQPNPDLTPERSRTWDLSWFYKASRNLTLGLSLYQFTQSNLIAADANRKFQNLGDRTEHGAELEAQWQATRQLRLAGHLTYRHERTSQSVNMPLPTEKAYLRADWSFAPDWHWNLQANWFGARKAPRINANDQRDGIPAFAIVDTTLRYQHHDNLEFSASVRNLFNQDAREFSGAALQDNLPLPRRGLYLEAIYSF